MKKLMYHQINMDLVQKQITAKARLLEVSLKAAQSDPQHLGSLLTIILAYTGYLSVAKPNFSEICKVLHLGNEAAVAIFTLATTKKSKVEVKLGNSQSIQFSATGPTSYADVGSWLKALYIAIICRDTHALNTLTNTSIDTLRSSSTKAEESFYLFADGLQGLLKAEQDTSVRMLAALKATDPELPHFDVEYVMYIIVPLIALFFKILDKEPKEFNLELAKALELHKKYWSKGDRKFSPTGYLALGPLALATLAYDIGIPIEVESDYLPIQLIEGVCK